MGLTVNPQGRADTTGVNLREAVLSVSRAIEDANWVNLSVDERADAAQLTYTERKDAIKRARMFARQNPLAKQAQSLLVNYALGRGVSLTAANKSLVGRLVDEFWNDKVNKAVFTGEQAMAEFIQGAFTDGAQYLVLFPDKEEGTLQLGWLDPMFVEDIITDPENVRVNKWVKVRKPKGGYNFKDGTYEASGDDDIVYYRWWTNTDGMEDDDDEKPKRRRGKADSNRPSKVEEGLVYQAKRGKGKFGQSELLAAMDWLRAHKHFMEDRATLHRAAASIAWKKKRKNASSTDVASEIARLTSSLANPGYPAGYETNPPNSAAGTYVANDNADMEWMKTDVGKGGDDERLFRMMAGAGMGGIPNHYFGDEANANLASATSMELPLLKAYEGWQQWLGDVVSDLIEFMLETAHEADRIGERDDRGRYTDAQLSAEKVLGTPEAVPMEDAPKPQATKEADPPFGKPKPPEPPGPQMPVEQVTFAVERPEPKKGDKVDWYVDVDFPPIVVKDIKPHFESLKILAEFMPSNPEASKLVLTEALSALGFNDIDQIIGNLFPPLPPGAKPSPMLTAGQQAQQVGMGQTGQKLLGPGKPMPTQEAMAPVRVHRFITAVQEAAREANGG